MSGITSTFAFPKSLIAKRSPNALILASVVTGFAWYFTNRQVSDFNQRQQLLINRVQKEETAEKFKQSFNFNRVQDWDCKKVNLDGVLKGGRFFIKRKRGNQEGYLVLAPFVVNTVNQQRNEEEMEGMNQNRKFILNLGWIPKTHKHLAFNAVPADVAGEEVTYEDREEAVRKQKEDGLKRDPLNPGQTVRITNVTAYVRKAESEDRWNGRVNYPDLHLFKWMDLYNLTRLFRVFNEAEGESIYLQKALRSDELQTIPIAASKETVISDLKTESKHHQLNSNRQFWMTTGLAFGAASWITFF